MRNDNIFYLRRLQVALPSVDAGNIIFKRCAKYCNAIGDEEVCIMANNNYRFPNMGIRCPRP
jgi:hypothetical protein